MSSYHIALIVANIFVWFNINLTISRNMFKDIKKIRSFLSNKTLCMQLERGTIFITENLEFLFMKYYTNMEGLKNFKLLYTFYLTTSHTSPQK